VIDLRALPSLTVAGEVSAETENLFWGGDFKALWPSETALVWSGGQNYWLWYDFGAPLAMDAALAYPGYPFRASGGGYLFAFGVEDPAAPQYLSEVSLAGEKTAWWNYSSAYAAEHLVFLSHQTSVFLEGVTPPWPTSTSTTQTSTASPDGSEVDPDPAPVGTWVLQHFLDVVDFSQPKEPVVRPPAGIPGRLTGLSRQGALIYTVGPRWNQDWTSDYTDYLTAGAYDGAAVYPVDSMALPQQWPHPVQVVDEAIFIGQPGVGDNTGVSWDKAPAVEAWTLPDSGQLTLLGRTELDLPPNVLAEFPGLLAAQLSNGGIVLMDRADPGALAVVGESEPSGCLWYNLSYADGELGRGLWVPLGIYGVATIPVTNSP